MAKTKEKKVLLRIPVKLAKEVTQRAERDKRSVNSQIVHELDWISGRASHQERP